MFTDCEHAFEKALKKKASEQKKAIKKKKSKK